MAIRRSELEKIARQLRSALEIIEAELEPIEIDPEVKAEVERKMAARICLAWDHVIPDGDPVLRGNCETDYHTNMARVRRGEISERELMQSGKLGPKGRPGRKAIQDMTPGLKVAELAERYNAAHPEKPKKQGKKGKGDGQG